jgi:transcription initiation factor IIE alpha subunit
MDTYKVKGEYHYQCKEVKTKLDEALCVIRELEWSDHHYDPAHGHSFSCPMCGGASKEGDLRNIYQEFGHKKGMRYS